jgi:hypothetical protein
VVGKGSIFSFELPLEKKKSDPIEAVWVPPLSDPGLPRWFFFKRTLGISFDK